ncbi:MAG TPA: Crp/Fnr family transcriptional regulator [Xenococcaceae cyanobacterium]
MTVSIFKKNWQLFYANEQLPLASEYLWLIIDGVVKSSTINQKGKHITFSYWTAQDVVGKPLSNNTLYVLKCITSVKAEKIITKDWQKLSSALMRHGQQIRDLTYIIKTPKASQRLLLLLNWLANKFNDQLTAEQIINLNITHQELSEIIGVSRITVTKLLSEFEQDGIIFRPERGKIILNYPQKLN